MTNETKHKSMPLPVFNIRKSVCIYDSENYIDQTPVIAECDTFDRAAHIVKCVNMHDELVACCNKIINNWGNLHHKDLMQLRSAVEKAGAL